MILDKKSLRKRIRTFFRKSCSPEKSIKFESKLAKVQKQFLKNSSQYQTIIVNEPVGILSLSNCLTLISLEKKIVEDDIDWWSKYYASQGQLTKCGYYLKKGYETLTVRMKTIIK